MKKLIVLLVIAVFFATVTSAQTIKEVKKEVPTELQSFQKRLEEVRNRIFYLEVTLPAKIVNDSTFSNDKKEAQEKHFSKDELLTLYDKKQKLEESIVILEESSYKVDKHKLKKALSSELPDRMTAREYRRRNRTQAFSSLDLSGGVINGKEELQGLLINDKINDGETAYFQFERIDIQEYVHRPSIMVAPKTEKIIHLPMGIYKCTMRYSSYIKEEVVHVDPRQTVSAGKDNIKVHFWAKKERWEY